MTEYESGQYLAGAKLMEKERVRISVRNLVEFILEAGIWITAGVPGIKKPC